MTEGTSSLDTSALTGESVPRSVSPGEEIISGCINLSGVLTVQTTKAFGDSTVARVLDLVENASSRKSRSEHFISRFARYYTPAVVVGAVLLALAPPLIRLAAGMAPDWSDWGYRALTFLVISCPCALVISIPLTFFAGIGGASRTGILVKGSNYLEALARTDTVVFDKTGTLTRGVFEVTAIHHSPGRRKSCWNMPLWRKAPPRTPSPSASGGPLERRPTGTGSASWRRSAGTGLSQRWTESPSPRGTSA